MLYQSSEGRYHCYHVMRMSLLDLETDVGKESCNPYLVGNFEYRATLEPTWEVLAAS